MQIVEVKQPKLDEHIQSLIDGREELKQQISEKELAAQAIVAEHEAAQVLRDTNTRIARVVGRISLYLETVELVDDDSLVRREVEEAREIVGDYQRQLDTDEVDAMLDEANVGRFRELLRELSEMTQFIMITHNRATVQVADIIYGVTMWRDSTSQILSLKVDELEKVINNTISGMIADGFVEDLAVEFNLSSK